MSASDLKLYHSSASPNARRVRILIAEKGQTVPLVAVDLGQREQHSDTYRQINPRRVVPTLVLPDGTTLGETPVILRYLDEVLPGPSLFGSTPEDRAVTAMWERRVSLRVSPRSWKVCSMPPPASRGGRSRAPMTTIKSRL